MKLDIFRETDKPFIATDIRNYVLHTNYDHLKCSSIFSFNVIVKQNALL